jgi:hypothetical protein
MTKCNGVSVTFDDGRCSRTEAGTHEADGAQWALVASLARHAGLRSAGDPLERRPRGACTAAASPASPDDAASRT